MKKVIYTCLVGNYDKLLQPLYISGEYDYVCFSNDILETQVGVWKIKRIPFSGKNDSITSRYPKLNPHLVLPEYEYSLWIDAAIQIIGEDFIKNIDSLIQRDTLFGVALHPHRNCIYEEIIQLLQWGMIGYFSGKYWHDFLEKDGYPENNGLYENNVILRKHNDSVIKRISEEWWRIYQISSKRDQLSLCYIFWKKEFLPSVISFKSGLDVRLEKSIIYHKPRPLRLGRG